MAGLGCGKRIHRYVIEPQVAAIGALQMAKISAQQVENPTSDVTRQAIIRCILSHGYMQILGVTDGTNCSRRARTYMYPQRMSTQRIRSDAE